MTHPENDEADDFTSAFQQLHRLAGAPDAKQIETWAAMTLQNNARSDPALRKAPTDNTIDGWLKGKHRPRDLKQLMLIVWVLNGRAAARNRVVEARLTEPDAWKRRLQQAPGRTSAHRNTDGPEVSGPAADTAQASEAKTRGKKNTILYGTAIAVTLAGSFWIASFIVTSMTDSGKTGHEPYTSSSRVSRNSQSSEAGASANAPVKVISVDSVDDDKYSWAFEESRYFTSADLAAMSIASDYDRYNNWFQEKGAVRVGSRMDLLTVEGNSANPVEINGLQVDKKCRKPFSGTLFYSPGQAGLEDIRMQLNLDEQITTPKDFDVLGGHTGETAGNFFARHTISLKKGERAKILIEASSAKYYCEYTLNFKITAGDERLTQKVMDDGKPFKLTALFETGEKKPWNAYRSAYLGGVYNTCGGFKFKRIDPTDSMDSSAGENHNC
ncbi:hypothetical protein [Streptomyces sp. NPDC058202]|uniref:hypothetical protein n=1 Tax=Streptomyces sp. NPDC058202 TaxID=3346380 RepID=UPI0036E98B68